MSKPIETLYDQHLTADVDHRGHQLRKGSGFIQVTPQGAQSTLWKLHFSVDPGQDLTDLKRSWDVFNKVVDSDPAFSSAFKVTKPDIAAKMNNPQALQAGKQITYYIPDTMKPETLERFVGTVEREFQGAGIKPGPQVKFDRAVPGSAGFSSYRSDVAAPRYMQAVGKTGDYIGSRELQSLQWAMEEGDPALKTLKPDQLYNLSDKPDPFRQIKIPDASLPHLKTGVAAAETAVEKKAGSLWTKAAQMAKAVVKHIPKLGVAVAGGAALYEYTTHQETAKPAAPVAQSSLETSPTRSFNPRAQATLEASPTAQPVALRPERKSDMGPH